MSRFVIMTVGMTHSGKSTFARLLEERLEHAVVIDQDNHASFVNQHYRALLPKEGANQLKFAITSTIINYAIQKTQFHLIIANSNLDKTARQTLLAMYTQQGFKTVLVHFDYTLETLQARTNQTERSTAIFRSASSFTEVLNNQSKKLSSAAFRSPTSDESDYYYKINENVLPESIISELTATILASTSSSLESN